MLRRVDFSLDINKDTYQSNEIRPDLQVSDFRHGVRRVTGVLKGELSPGTYARQIEALLKRDFAAGAVTTGASITIAGTGPTWTVTRAAGSFLTDGLKAGDVVQLSVGTFNAANITKNLFIISLTATVLTVQVVNGTALVAEGPISTSTVTVMGKKTYVPSTGHTDKSFSIENWFGDISQSEVFSGCKFQKMTVQLPPTGMATIDLDVIGQNITTAATRYFTSPTAVTSTGVMAAVNGAVIVNGVALATITGMNFMIDGSFTDAPVVGQNIVPFVFPGRVRVSGQFTCYLTDATLRDLFLNETEIAINTVFSANNTANSDILAVTFPRVKLGSAGKSDSEGGIVQTFNFTALYNAAGGAGTSSEQTTLTIQDTQA